MLIRVDHLDIAVDRTIPSTDICSMTVILETRCNSALRKARPHTSWRYRCSADCSSDRSRPSVVNDIGHGNLDRAYFSSRLSIDPDIGVSRPRSMSACRTTEASIEIPSACSGTGSHKLRSFSSVLLCWHPDNLTPTRCDRIRPCLSAHCRVCKMPDPATGERMDIYHIWCDRTLRWGRHWISPSQPIRISMP